MKVIVIETKNYQLKNKILLNMDNMDVMVHDNLVETIKELFYSLFPIYQIGVETQIRGIDFIFDCVNFLYYKRKKINFKRRGSCIDSPD